MHTLGAVFHTLSTVLGRLCTVWGWLCTDQAALSGPLARPMRRTGPALIGAGRTSPYVQSVYILGLLIGLMARVMGLAYTTTNVYFVYMTKHMSAAELTDLRRTWEAYRDWALGSLGAHCRGGDVLTDAARARGKITEDIFNGPWHHWASLITEDAAEWFATNERMTFTDFMRDMRPANVDMKCAELGTAAVRNLNQLRLDLEMRTQWIVQAREAAIPWGELEAATGLTRVALNNMVKRAHGGVLPA